MATFKRRRLDDIILHEESIRRHHDKKSTRSGLFQQLALNMEPFAPIVLSETRREKLETKIIQAGVEQTPEEIAGEQLAGLIIGIIMGSIGLLVGGLGIVTLLFFGFMGWFHPAVKLNKERRKRREEIDEQLLSFIDVFSLMLESRASLFSGMEKAAHAVGGPLGDEMKEMLNRSRSRGLTESLQQMALRINMPNL